MTGQHAATTSPHEMSRGLRAPGAEVRPDGMLVAEHVHTRPATSTGRLARHDELRRVLPSTVDLAARADGLALPDLPRCPRGVPRRAATRRCATLDAGVIGGPRLAVVRRPSWTLRCSHDTARIPTPRPAVPTGVEVALGLQMATLRAYQ